MSRYDPRDLFSQQRERVALALRQLWAVPNNNLRVFLDGELVVGKQPQAHTMMHGADGDQAKTALRGYLTAATAKDCGVMVTLQQATHGLT
ncbi:inositol-pentakisphosphate 2-kinase [Haematococcus lacustris]|uniref:Inositol-pentakisphosphate 2-kinase n=1 Tax=Haematococcus lacustris TaxID=44745 RepID=A0A699ZEL0_HAELA|nr:inositol-pentakisphosphate 2-kinase [Haematococcus lacustris]